MSRLTLPTDPAVEAMHALLVVYLGIGVVVLGVMLPGYWRERPSKLARLMMEELEPERRSFRYRLLGGILAPLVAGIAVVVAWPGAIAFAAWNRLKNRHQQSDETDDGDIYDEDDELGARRWKVLPAHLKKQVTPESVVAQEKVVDPLRAAPNVPFGFLLGRWVDFMAHWNEGDELWTFEVPPADFDYARRGYAIVRRGLPVASFVTDVVEV